MYLGRSVSSGTEKTKLGCVMGRNLQSKTGIKVITISKSNLLVKNINKKNKK